jgi:hypothetical protein
MNRRIVIADTLKRRSTTDTIKRVLNADGKPESQTSNVEMNIFLELYFVM